jgi:hypothetical protein
LTRSQQGVGFTDNLVTACESNFAKSIDFADHKSCCSKSPNRVIQLPEVYFLSSVGFSRQVQTSGVRGKKYHEHSKDSLCNDYIDLCGFAVYSSPAH